MPRLIDAHFHACGVDVKRALIDKLHPVVLELKARDTLEAALRCGFRAVRDAAGALASAIESRLIEGAGFFYAGATLSQTGGHGDTRIPEDHDTCGCAYCGLVAPLARS